MSRETEILSFLAQVGWDGAQRIPLVADASFRSYEKLRLDDKHAILMNAPPNTNDSILIFEGITQRLRTIGLSAPEVFASDDANGFMLIEDLGTALFARDLENDPTRDLAYYRAAVDVLVHIHQSQAGHGLPAYNRTVYLREASLLPDWYMANLNADFDRSEYLEMIDQICAPHAQEQVLVMRDYHAENLLWLGGRSGVARVGLLDYQDALLGHPAYDLVSLLEDARRDTSPQFQKEILDYYIIKSGVDAIKFRAGYAAFGLQRNAKIIGIFARLAIRDRKANYIDLLPRVWAHFQRDLAHPNHVKMAEWVAQHVPPPTPENLDHLRRVANA